MLTPIVMPHENPHGLVNNVNPKSKKLKCSRFWTLFVSTKNSLKVGEKQSTMSLAF